MTPRQRLAILLLGILGALLGYGFIWLATYDERDETRCRLCGQRGSMVKVRIERNPDINWDQVVVEDGTPIASWHSTGERIDCFCRSCKSGWHSGNPPKRKR